MAQPQHEQGKTDAIAKKADEADRHRGPGRGQRRAMRQCQQQVHRARNQSLQHGDLHRIG